MFEKRVESGETLIKQGDQGDYFYVIDSGAFDVLKDGQKIGQVKQGGSFGELALMYDTGRAASVLATSAATVWAIDRANFRRIVLGSTMRKRRTYESILQSVPILSTLSPAEIAKVADALEPRRFEDDEKIIRQGDEGTAFFLLVDGEVIVSASSEETQEPVEVGRLKKGDYFGEVALITRQPRAATVTACGSVECVMLDIKVFTRLLGPCMELLKRNMATYKAYENWSAV